MHAIEHLGSYITIPGRYVHGAPLSGKLRVKWQFVDRDDRPHWVDTRPADPAVLQQ